MHSVLSFLAGIWQAVVHHVGTLDTTLAILAIIFATKQFFDARKHTKEMKEIARSMSTRFIGELPKNMIGIVELVEKAHTSLDIMVDCIDYGSYSAPEQFQKYLGKLKEKARSQITVRLLIYNDEQRREASKAQFPSGEYDQTKKSQKYKHFFEIQHPGEKVPDTCGEFLNSRIGWQNGYAQEIKQAGVEIRTVSVPSVMFLWLKDEEDAVASFSNANAAVDELGFRTRDGRLIDTFQRLFDETWEKSPTLEFQPPPPVTPPTQTQQTTLISR